MPSVLFVCTGNICRSPFAERLSVRLVEDLSEDHPARGWEFASAGISGLDGWEMCPEMAVELEARGGSADGFVARQLTRTMAREADLLLVLEPVHRAWVLEEWPSLVRRTWLLGQAARVAPTLPAPDLLDGLLERRDAAQPGDEVPDPYRRGPAAAARAAGQIETLLRSLLGTGVPESRR